jgi:ADP-dependent NAD(P)H-hydrate dehydratase / NAD(P)H-hydrate epimerase
MLPILRPEEMVRADRATIEAGTPVEVLMDRAGRAVARAAIRVAGGRSGRRALVVCGTGNNGGDGFVVARRLAEEGLGVTCMVTFDARKVKGAPAHHLGLMMQAGVTPRPFDPGVAERDFDVVVDAIFGTGFSGDPRGLPAEAIDALDGLPHVVAVDMPSGVDGLTGNVERGAIHAEVTVAMAAQKLGTVLLPGASYAGRVEIADIGIDVQGWKHGDADSSADRPGPYIEWVEAGDVSASMAPRPLGAHKRSSGSVAILAGSDEMRGAALLCSLGALRMGAGYVTLGSSSKVQSAASVAQPELLCRTVTDRGVLGKEALDRFSDVVEKADALAVGPGMGTGDDQRALVEKVVIEVSRPVVLDADALNVLAWDVGPLAERTEAAVITPHPAELARLLGCETEEVTTDRIGAAAEASKRFPGCAVVLKGYRTIVTFGRGAAALVIPTGGPELATAGTGDVLTGALAAVLAGGLPRGAAAAVAAFVHGLAGTIAAESTGASGVLARDVAEALPAARIRTRSLAKD